MSRPATCCACFQLIEKRSHAGVITKHWAQRSQDWALSQAQPAVACPLSMRGAKKRRRQKAAKVRATIHWQTMSLCNLMLA